MKGFGVSFSPGQHVALVWDGGASSEDLEHLVSQLQERISPGGKVSVENVQRLALSAHTTSSFDVVLLGLLPGSVCIHSYDVLAEAARILKPGGVVVIQEPVVANADKDGELRTVERLSSALTLSGLTEVTQVCQEPLSPQQAQAVAEKLRVPTDGVRAAQVRGKKPNFEVGSSRQLSLSKHPVPVKPLLDPTAVKLWTLSASDMNDDNVDLLDSDELLDQDDLKKPLPSSLSSSGCGEGGEKKRKACKNCTCGLAEELEEKTKQMSSEIAPSACGNCYLGDAFRCASCPYLGMPAFRPGEKVLLNPTHLQDT